MLSTRYYEKVYGIVAVTKGVIMAAVLAATSIPFLQSLLIVVVSALLTGIFGLLTAIITAKEARANREIMKSVEKKVEEGNASADAQVEKVNRHHVR